MEYTGWATPHTSTPLTPRGWGDVDTPPKSPMLHYEEARLRDTGERERERERRYCYLQMNNGVCDT